MKNWQRNPDHIHVQSYYMEVTQATIFMEQNMKCCSVRFYKKTFLTNPIFSEGFGYDQDSSANFSRAMSCFQQSSTSFANINPGS